MKEKKICELYRSGISMRKIGEVYNSNHKIISRILKQNGIETRKPLNLRGKKKYSNNKDRSYNNMATHLRFDVSSQWLMQFDDFEKLKLLNDAITNRSGRWAEDTKWYKSYIVRFYDDQRFNKIYLGWIKSDFHKYKKPSIDHIIPKAKGGTNSLPNLQFLTWFENRCKNDISQKEWDKMKENIKEYFYG